MHVTNSLKWFFALALTTLSVHSLADGFDNEYEEKPWAEIEVQLPAFPEQVNLIPFQVGAMADTKYLIDGNSLSVGADGVFRYILVVISCATAERRFYAYGRPDKTWSKAKSNQWVKIQGSTNNHHVELYSNYFCAIGAAYVRNADEARRVLRSGGQSATIH